VRDDRRTPVNSGVLTLPRFLPSSAFKPSVEGVHCSKGKLGGGVYICNAWLQLQKILPSALFVSFGIGLVTHTDKHSRNCLRAKISQALSRDFQALARNSHTLAETTSSWRLPDGLESSPPKQPL
jgi:hypothetical protein